jgi:hypothetical protein
MTKDKTVTMSRERRPVCHACVSRPRDEHCPICDIAAPVVERQEPVMKLEAERLWEGDGEYSVSFCKSGWLDECRKAGGTFFLFASPPAPVAVMPDVDALAQIIRQVDGDHSLGAGALAERIIDKVKELNQ